MNLASLWRHNLQRVPMKTCELTSPSPQLYCRHSWGPGWEGLPGIHPGFLVGEFWANAGVEV